MIIFQTRSDLDYTYPDGVTKRIVYSIFDCTPDGRQLINGPFGVYEETSKGKWDFICGFQDVGAAAEYAYKKCRRQDAAIRLLASWK